MEILHPNLHKIAIIRFSSLGDIILTLPVLKLLRSAYPSAQIGYIVKEQYADMLRNFAPVDKVHILPQQGDKDFSSLKNLTKKVKEEHYDLIIDLHSNLRSVYLSLFCGARKIVRYKKASFQRRLLVKFNFRRDKFLHTSEKYVDPLRRGLGISGSVSQPELKINEVEDRSAKQRLKEIFGPNKYHFVALGPGARHYTKRWPLDRYMLLARKLTEKRHDTCRILILGDEQDNLVVPEVKNTINDTIISLAGKLTLSQTMGVLSNMDLLITNDTGLMHCATAVNTPVLAIFGSTSRELGFFPMGNQAEVIEKDLPCRPCSLHGSEACPIDTFECMESISVDDIYDRTLDKLNPHSLNSENKKK